MSASSLELNPRLRDYRVILNRCVCLTHDRLTAFLSRTGIADQATELGKKLLICSHVRHLSLSFDDELKIAKAVAHVESEYESHKAAYVTTVDIGQESILDAKCTCVAQNRLTGSCKHQSSLLFC